MTEAFMSISTPLARGRCTERNTFAYPQINDLQVLFLVRNKRRAAPSVSPPPRGGGRRQAAALGALS